MGARILVIEDNPTNLELMVYLLRAFGHTPLVAADGEEGLAAARAQRPDLIICDIQLPGLDGYAVAKALKDDSALRAIPLVAVTAYAMVGDRDRMLAAGFDGYLAKPIAAESFVPQVEGFLRPGLHAVTHARSSNTAPSAAPVPLVETASIKARILIVDDQATNRQLVSSMLSPLGYTVMEAAGVTEALRLVRQRRPDLILCDIHLGAETGYELLQAVVADPDLRSIPVVIASSTSWNAPQVAKKCLEMGAAAMLPWPILDPPALTAALEPHLTKTPGDDRGHCPCR